MPNDPKEDEIPLGIWCDLLEKELKTALDDLAKIRKAKSPSEKRDIGLMLRAALGNARHYLSGSVQLTASTKTDRDLREDRDGRKSGRQETADTTHR